MGGGGAGAGGGRGRWSDDEDEGGNNFKRRGGPGGGPGGNRFRGDRGGEVADDRRATNSRGGGRGGPREDRERPGFGNRRGSRDDSNRHSIGSMEDGSSKTAPEPESKPKNADNVELANANKNAPPAATVPEVDTEEDWDRELQDYEARMEAQKPAEGAAPQSSTNETLQEKTQTQTAAAQGFAKPAEVASDSSAPKPQADASSACTPLYDELPPPTAPSAEPSVQAQSSRVDEEVAAAAAASPPSLPEPEAIHIEAAPKEQSAPPTPPAVEPQAEAPSAEETTTSADTDADT